jgi:hypothetical protein
LKPVWRVAKLKREVGESDGQEEEAEKKCNNGNENSGWHSATGPYDLDVYEVYLQEVD